MIDSVLQGGLNDAFTGPYSGRHMEDLVSKNGIRREDQARWALRSQQRFGAAQAAGRFKSEIVAVEIPGRGNPTSFARDEDNRPETTAEHGWAERNGLEPMARLASYGLGAVEPGFFGLGPVPAVRQALSHAGGSVDRVDRVEINEAFAGIALACLHEIGFAEDVVNVEGGAYAHGHPIGASGTVLATRLMHSMKRDGCGRGIVTLCIGGGQGIALAIESI